MRIKVMFEPRDLWIGVYWTTFATSAFGVSLAVYVCLLPMLPIRIEVPIRGSGAA